MIDAKEFSETVEVLVSETGVTYMDAIVHVCEQKQLEVETGAKLINTKIKKSVEAEAEDLNMLKIKRGNKLPI